MATRRRVPRRRGRATSTRERALPRAIAVAERRRDRRVCAGPVPQQPPTIATPCVEERPTTSPTYSGVAGYTSRPPTSAGPPALGHADQRKLAAAAIARSTRTIRSACAGPSPQFTPIASTPSAASAAATCPGVDAEQRPVVAGERRAHDQREAGRRIARRTHRQLDLAQVGLGLDHEQVDARIGERGRLLPIRVGRLLRSAPGRRARGAPRADRASPRRARPGSRAIAAGGADRLDAIREPELFEAEPVRTERVRQHEPRAGLDEGRDGSRRRARARSRSALPCTPRPARRCRSTTSPCPRRPGAEPRRAEHGAMRRPSVQCPSATALVRCARACVRLDHGVP